MRYLKVLGLIVEYNPFHNGHLHHLQEAGKKTGADLTVAVMSGPFLQRGEPALVDKWTRAETALKAGIDVVIELPYVFAVQPADRFADGAVSMLEACGVTDICFGSENGEIKPFQDAAESIEQHGQQIDQQVTAHLSAGKSFPRAYNEAVTEAFQGSIGLDTSKPNNILGLEYVKAIRRRKNVIQAHTIKRIGSSFHDQDPSSAAIASATALRKIIFDKHQPFTNVRPYVPDISFQLLHQKKENLTDWEAYFPFLKYNLMTAETEELANIYDCSEGLEHRFKKNIHQTKTFRQFIDAVKAKRYTRTKLQRLAVHTLNRVNKSDITGWSPGKPAPYIRLLGMNTAGQAHLSAMKKTMSMPLITKASAGKHPWFDLDLKASHIADFVQSSDSLKEYQKKPIIID
ncbi:nucleotidyltransferase [Salisediminibacterium halotolerans]|uniref:nucleotidyltransferase n=1 Tax=Salisediminibacterium halotolerans TaxID=517425 RepID=UPI000B897AF9